MKLIIDISEGIYKHIDTIQNGSIGAKQIINSVKNGIPAYKAIPSAKPKTGYISIDDAMSVFDDFMCGEVDEDGTDTFLEMLKDRVERSE